jgi:uncharacterized membrane protein YfhO
VLPRAYIVGAVESVASDKDAIARLKEIDPAVTAVVVNGQPLTGRSAEAKIEVYTSNRVVIRATIDAPGMLVFADTWLEGWRAVDNGQAVPVERVNVALRGVRLLASGEHTIEFVYQPSMMAPGLAITLLTLTGLAGWTVIRARRS